MAKRTLLFICVAVTLLLALPAMGDDDFFVLPSRNGPNIFDKLNIEWQKFENTLPSWFKGKYDYAGKTEWGDHSTSSGYEKDLFWAEYDKILWKEQGKCWMEERTTIMGSWTTLYYGTIHYKLILTKEAREELRGLYKNAKIVMNKAIQNEITPNSYVDLLMDMASHIPVVGNAIEIGHGLFDAGGKLKNSAAIIAAFNSFMEEYNALSPKLGLTDLSNKIVVTVRGGYDEAVPVNNPSREVYRKSKKTELECEDEFWEQAEEGKKYTEHKFSIPFKGKAVDELIKMYKKDKDKRDDKKLMIEIRKSLTGKWVGVGKSKSSPNESTPLKVEFQTLKEGVVYATFIYGDDKKQHKREMQVAQKDWYEYTFVVRMTKEEAAKIKKIRDEGFKVPYTTYKAEITSDGATITGYQLDMWGDKVFTFTLHRK